MTSTGHVLTGAAIGIACLPRKASKMMQTIQILTFILLANAPDIPLKNWGHDLYYFSHSVFVNLALMAILILFLSASRVSRKTGGWVVIACGMAAWLSHLLLDSFYNHGEGEAIFWPLSDGRLVLPIPWFSVMADVPPPVTPEMVRIFMIEVASYGTLVLLALFGRWIVSRRSRE